MIEHILIYLFKSSLILALMYAFYIWVLRRYTFFQLNRFVLLIQLGCIPMIPLIQLPGIYIPQHQYVEEIFFEQPVSGFEQPKSSSSATLTESSKHTIELSYILFGGYFIGVIFCFFRLLVNLILLIRRSKRAANMDRYENYKIIWENPSTAPFSFFNWIFLPKDKYDPQTLAHIIAHEKVHIDQKHSWDMLIANIFLVFYWFNPFAWMYKKAIETNLEYATDQKVLMSGVSKKIYMYNLLELAAPDWKQQLGMNYNQSSLKNRIVMMNRKLSTTKSFWAYFVWILLVPSFVCLNGPKNAGAQDVPFSLAPLKVVLLITEDASEAELQQLEQQVSDLDVGWTFSYKDLSYHQNGKIDRISTQTQLGGSTSGSFRGYGPIKTFVPIIFGLYSDSTQFSGTLGADLLDEMLERYDDITILSAGISTQKSSLRKLYSTVEVQTNDAKEEKLKELEENGWKATYYGKDEFGEINENIWNQIEQKLASLNPSQTWYIVDGGEKLQKPPQIDWWKIEKVETERTYEETFIPNSLTLKKKEVTEARIQIKLK